MVYASKVVSAESVPCQSAKQILHLESSYQRLLCGIWTHAVLEARFCSWCGCLSSPRVELQNVR